ncbi:SMP-30/gluconolactonase/LRE family protein [Bdellovibrio sp. NC01]|uniref:SMP-30/gluconolactonase/LRE family protein n=1 Tax=Bdellovibrio sp. NC01 TaxID=2220073 RepID=UPI00115936AA|nr:SMP-30/gluconolactonase/LRE family protein [Bdellovibrio sp. NC01]QDK37013.1 SMP-30/gluconolactonase/LRE family protein [Bdellovibrio sp. NC01]
MTAQLLLSGFIALITSAQADVSVSTPRAPTVSPSASINEAKVLTGNGLFTKGIEGPAVDADGNLYVVNFAKSGTIGVVKAGSNKPELFTTLPDGGVSNSIRFNAKKEMLVADRIKHQLLKIDLQSKAIVVVATNKDFNQPNDFTVSRSGDIYFSDPSWSSKKKGNIWLLTTDGKFSIVGQDLKAVNGIELSPDESKLYFTESISGALYSFDLKDHKLTNKKLVYQFKKDTVDGIKVDMSGAIYAVRIGEGKVDRISPDGKLLSTIQLHGKEPTNLTFGGKDGKTLFITIRDHGNIEAFQTNEAGRDWNLLHQSQAK